MRLSLLVVFVAIGLVGCSAAVSLVPNNLHDRYYTSVEDFVQAGGVSSRVRSDSTKIINELVNGSSKGEAMALLSEWTDTFGNRISGSDRLENAIDWLLEHLKADGYSNVHGEDAMVPYWQRNEEWARLETPQKLELQMLGLGTSVATPNGKPLTAEAIVVETFEELANLPKNETQGKIVVFNQQCDWIAKPVRCYGETANYRVQGASKAAQAGAVACLVRTVGAFSIASPHTGVQAYEEGVTKIPTAAIAIEDANLLARLQKRGQKIEITLFMSCENYPMRKSRNVVAEIPGSTFPDEIVLMSGHLDSWDVGQGVMDDGGGFFISWEVLNVVRKLGLKPARTLRLVGWTCEEFGGFGSAQYFKDHQADAPNFDLVMESDMGTFYPYGLQFTGVDAAKTILESILEPLVVINASQVIGGGGGEDIGPWINVGVPGSSLANENSKYFFFHHSWGDTVDVYEPAMLDLSSAVWAVGSYGVASLPKMLPRK